MGLSPDQIVYIGSADGLVSCTWDEFERLANFDYSASPGVAYIPSGLVIEFAEGLRFIRIMVDDGEVWRLDDGSRSYFLQGRYWVEYDPSVHDGPMTSAWLGNPNING